MKILNLIAQGILIAVLAITLLIGLSNYEGTFASLFIFSIILMTLQIIVNTIYLWKTRNEFIKNQFLSILLF